MLLTSGRKVERLVLFDRVYSPRSAFFDVQHGRHRQMNRFARPSRHVGPSSYVTARAGRQRLYAQQFAILEAIYAGAAERVREDSVLSEEKPPG
ncbi:hypothetical protein E3H11_36015 [Bradyrhizobium brasilense]|uniref:hypothetical protein n=1 Tax=Bradyrhizobium brasilense TaxID=1419277 RepID=UPI0014567ADF|nr:hypothetical protein [Bradyrhizobium brasilense]NLS74210.1 hypothetical protein [Bradyrhizobium brasilense]